MIRMWPALLSLLIIVFSATPETARAQSDVDIQIESFEEVWETVNEHHFDPTFGGLDWRATYDDYLDLVKLVDDDAEFLEVVNRMLRELDLSHYSVFKFDRTNGSRTANSGVIGLETRVLDGQVVITSVRADFPAADAGLRTGYIIEEIDDLAVEDIMKDSEQRLLPNAPQRSKRAYAARYINHHLLGPTGDSVTLTYLDEADTTHELTIVRAPRPGTMRRVGPRPPVYVEFEATRIADNIGYIRFNRFIEPVDERFEQAIDNMADVRGLILDIRGNPGGYHTVGEAIASNLIEKETLFSIFRYRDSTKRVTLQPSTNTYGGPVVVLIDELNASASERFAACLQSIGRAVVIGETSIGEVGPARTMRLSNGASLYYLIAQSQTPDGEVLEGRGVTPDIVVRPSRETLLAGRDRQLDRAVEYING